MFGNDHHYLINTDENNKEASAVSFSAKLTDLVDGENIFYVEYLAVAPWNRDCLVRQREYKGVGSTLLKVALNYSVEKLGLIPGFSLHSLPQAKEYYEKLKNHP